MAHFLLIVDAQEDSLWYKKAEHFMQSRQRESCTLMQKILAHSPGLFVIADSGVAQEASVHALFLFSGSVLFPCLPMPPTELESLLYDFFKTRFVFCVTGERTSVKTVEYVLSRLQYAVNEQHDYVFMEYDGHTVIVPPCPVWQCSAMHEAELFPLHLGYIREEVMPQNLAVNAAAERLSFSRSVKAQMVFAIKQKSEFVAKAQTNAATEQYIQIGGVYTQQQWRRHGYASALVNHLARVIEARQKIPVLFAKEKNTAALHAYTRAGFVPVGHYRIVYYK